MNHFIDFVLIFTSSYWEKKTKSVVKKLGQHWEKESSVQGAERVPAGEGRPSAFCLRENYSHPLQVMNYSSTQNSGACLLSATM